MNAERLKSIINKVPAFRDLAVGHAHRLLQSGEVMLKPKGTTLCVEGDDSSDMFILLSGKLLVTCEDVELGSVGSSEVVGEMKSHHRPASLCDDRGHRGCNVVHDPCGELRAAHERERGTGGTVLPQHARVALYEAAAVQRTPGGQPPECVRLLLRRSAIDDQAGKCFFAIILEQDTGLLLRGPEKGETE